MIQLVVASLLILISVAGVVGNLRVIALELIGRNDAPPMVPYIPAICGVIGLLILPIEGARYWAWIPLIADPGCGLYLYQTWRIEQRSKRSN